MPSHYDCRRYLRWLSWLPGVIRRDDVTTQPNTLSTQRSATSDYFNFAGAIRTVQILANQHA
jgi:hypothetical protein